MPTTFLNSRTGRSVTDAEVRALLDRRASGSAGRKAFTDRLGLPATATNAEFFAAVDAKLAQRASSAPSAEDQLYARVTSRAAAVLQQPADMSDDAVYARLYGADATDA